MTSNEPQRDRREEAAAAHRVTTREYAAAMDRDGDGRTVSGPDPWTDRRAGADPDRGTGRRMEATTATATRAEPPIDQPRRRTDSPDPTADTRAGHRTDPRLEPTRADHAAAVATAEPHPDHRAVVARERAEFGGIKFGSAFFGWLAATGTAVLFTALIAAIGVGIGLGTGTDADEATNQANENPGTVGLVGAIALLAILFVSYYCGGYVAGRMARFNGAKQGFAVWLWSLLAAGVVAVISAVAGDKFDIWARLDGFPRLPISDGDLPTAAIVTAIAVAAVGLIGAILGGLAGMRYHRRVDRVGLQPIPPEDTTIS
jgi:hypothetical protein